ncbi:MAG: hypothetical protein WD851_19005 [Pirellulales bacterium]
MRISFTRFFALMAVGFFIARGMTALGFGGSLPNNSHLPVSALPGASDLPGFTDPRGRIPQLPFSHLSAPVLPQVGPRPDFATQPDGQLAPGSVDHFMNIYGPTELKRLYHWPNPRLQTLMPGGVNAGFLDDHSRPFPTISPPTFGVHWMGPSAPWPVDRQADRQPAPMDGGEGKRADDRFERAMNRSLTPARP